MELKQWCVVCALTRGPVVGEQEELVERVVLEEVESA